MKLNNLKKPVYWERLLWIAAFLVIAVLAGGKVGVTEPGSQDRSLAVIILVSAMTGAVITCWLFARSNEEESEHEADEEG